MYHMNLMLKWSVYLFSYIFIFYVYECFLPAFMYVYYMCVWCSRRSLEGVRSLITPIMGGCELPLGARNQTRIVGESNKSS